MSPLRLPDFLIIGAQKAGTTWLARTLERHPRVFLASQEIHFFDKGFNHRRGTDWYARHFDGVPTDVLAGEKTPDYLWAGGQGVEDHLPDVHRRVHELLPDARLLVVLRDPVARAVSAVQHIVRSGRVSPFHSIDDLLLGSKSHLVEGHGVLSYGDYAEQLERWLELYPREQLLVLIYEEDVVESPEQGLARAYAHLGVDLMPPPRENRRFNARKPSRFALAMRYYVPPLRLPAEALGRVLPEWRPYPGPETLQRLRERYAPSNERLFELLGRPIESWQGR